MVRIEVSLMFGEFLIFANVQDRLSETLSISSFPICTRIVVSQINEKEGGIPNLLAQKIVDHAGSSRVSHIDKLESDLLDCGFNYIANEGIEHGVSKFQCNEAVASCDLSLAISFESAPACESQIKFH